MPQMKKPKITISGPDDDPIIDDRDPMGGGTD